ncbi:MAG: iron-containing alcohol dehydrogenase, partial [Rubrivivax sp.]
YSLPAISDRLALLAVRARVGREGQDNDTLARKFLDAVDQLNADLGIPGHLAALQEADIPALAKAACDEANGYPVPRYMTQQQCEALIRQVLPPAPAAKNAAKNVAKKKRAARKTRV